MKLPLIHPISEKVDARMVTFRMLQNPPPIWASEALDKFAYSTTPHNMQRPRITMRQGG